MGLDARVDVKFARVEVSFQTVLVTKCYDIFFFILISVNFKVPLILHTKFQSNIPSHFGEMDINARVDLNVFIVDVNF